VSYLRFLCATLLAVGCSASADPNVGTSNSAEQIYATYQRGGTLYSYKEYIRKHPKAPFVGDARQQIARLREKSVKAQTKIDHELRKATELHEKQQVKLEREQGLVLAPSGRTLSITDGTNSVEVERHSDKNISLVLSYQGTKLSGRRVSFQFDNGPEYSSTAMKLGHEKAKDFVVDMPRHRTLTLWIPAEGASRAKFELGTVQAELQSLVSRCATPNLDNGGAAPRVTIAAARAARRYG